jgi:peptide/nickel transport system substrate-binding protein
MTLSPTALNAGALAALLAFCSLPSVALAQADARTVLTISTTVADISTLDPHRATAVGDKGVVSGMFDALVRFPPGSADPSELESDLAESWEVSPDHTVWTFHLRRGVPFHKGYGELTADDVVYSIQRAADPQRSSFAANFSIVDKVEAVDGHTVRITLKYPDAAFLGRVSNYHGGNIVSKVAGEKMAERFGQSPIGTGPFAFSDHVTQQHVRLVAHDGYFRGAPKLAGVTYRLIGSDSARELAFTAKEVDVAIGKREQRWVERTAKRGVKVDIFEPAEFRTLFINRNIAPLDNVKVRQAIAAAVNVDDIIRFAGTSVADRGCSAVPNGYLGQDCSAGTYAHDPALAKKLLVEAGYPNGITLQSVVSSNVSQLPIMEIVQAQLAKAGIKLNMEVVDHATYQAKSRQDQSAIVFYGAARFPNADYWLTEFYDSAAAIGAPGAMSNFAHCAVADAEIRQARVEPDAAKQLALWKTAQAKIHDDVCAVPLFGLKQVWMHSDAVDYGYTLKGALNLQPPITERTTVTRSAR